MALAYWKLLFCKIYTLYYGVPTEEFYDDCPLDVTPISYFEMVRRLVKYAHMHYKKIILVYVFMFIRTLLELAQPFYYGAVVAQVLNQHGIYDYSKHIHNIGMVILSKIIVDIIVEMKSQYVDNYGQEIEETISNDFFKAVVNRDIAEFDKYGTYCMNDIVYQTDDLVRFILHDFPNFIGTLIRFPGAVILIFSLSPELAMVSILSIPVLSFFEQCRNKIASERVSCVLPPCDRPKYVDVSGYIGKVLDTIKNVRAFGCQREETRKVQDMKVESSEQYVKMKLFEDVIELVSGSVAAYFNFVIIIFCGVLISAGRMSAESFFSYPFYHKIFEDSLYAIRDEIYYCIKVMRKTGKTFSFLDKENKVKRDGVLRPPIKGELKMENVSFTYETRPEKIVIKDFNLLINKGNSVALVGPSGAGKSTIINLLERFYAPDSGSITVDGIPIEEIEDEYYHKQIALVSRENVLYNRSIKENILYGCDWATEEQMIEAAKMANIHNFIVTLEEGYDTLYGYSGIEMTGGQKQRIALARALVRDPAILLLDEVTSSLDSESEGVVQEALERCCKDRTVIVIAHRLSTIRNVDKIVFLKEGHVTEHGTHEELMKIENGNYAKLVQSQEKCVVVDSIDDASDDTESMEKEDFSETYRDNIR